MVVEQKIKLDKNIVLDSSDSSNLRRNSAHHSCLTFILIKGKKRKKKKKRVTTQKIPLENIRIQNILYDSEK